MPDVPSTVLYRDSMKPNRIRSLRHFATCVALGWVALATPAQSEIGSGLIQLRQAVRDATNDKSVAIIATHPDDQWMLPAAYLRFRYGFRVSVILFTRGEGGQNITGPEVGDALGRIRTLETEASGRLLDCEIWYLNRLDGGYCRTGQEALDLWGRTGTTEDLARLLREIQPDIVLTTHHPAETHGHDHGLLAVLQPAVSLARSPEFVIDGLPPADIRRLFRGAAPEPPSLSLLADAVDSDRGETYRRLAYRAFTQHHSQAPFRSIDELFDPNCELITLPLDGLPKPPPSLFEGIDTLFDELAGVWEPSAIDALRTDIELRLTEAVEDVPAGLLRLALDLREQLEAVEAEPGSSLRRRLDRRIEALTRVARHAIAFGAVVELPAGSIAVPGEPFSFTIRTHFVADWTDDFFLESNGVGELTVDDHLPFTTTFRFDATLTLPPHLDATSQAIFYADRYQNPLGVTIGFSIVEPGREPRIIRVPVELPIELRPAVELEIHPPKILVPDGVDSVQFAVRVRRNTQDPIDGRLAIRSSLGVQPVPLSERVFMAGEAIREFQFRLNLPPNATTMKARVRLGEWSAELPLHRVAVSVDPGIRVGLVRGVDDTSRSLLRGLAVDAVELTETVLPNRDLSDLDTILVDIRALRSHSAAQAGFNRLIQFARNGGRLVVFYHKDQEFNLASSGFRGFPAELPLHIGKGRVTREDQPVTVLEPDHELFTTPNRIRPGDWDGWVQERGLYFPDVYSENYVELLGMADAGFEEERGAFLFGNVGRGEFVYCALSLYRQLKNLHPGACRLFANLVSHRRPR